MCDLWQNTLDNPVSPGAILEQIDYALAHAVSQLGDLAQLHQIKLYNAGSFFDPKAIPSEEDTQIAKRLAMFDRIIVECHPSLVGGRCLQFQESIKGKLEVALGLETVHPKALEKLNKRMTLEDFQSASSVLSENNIALRSFVLLQPPFVPEQESVDWAKKTVDFSISCGATVSCVIPTRTGNGATDSLAISGQFHEPNLDQLEDVMDRSMGAANHRVFADLWDLERFSHCEYCFDVRKSRLLEQNHSQVVSARITCSYCH
ncbi:MAG: radical SAM protein [Verrucomicrobiales bacterium]|nr:radical SAM protein [Verrucomicrobiales bacterium]